MTKVEECLQEVEQGTRPLPLRSREESSASVETRAGRVSGRSRLPARGGSKSPEEHEHVSGSSDAESCAGRLGTHPLAVDGRDDVAGQKRTAQPCCSST